MKNFVKDLSVIVVAVAAGLFFASAVQAQGVGNGIGNKAIIKIMQGNAHHKGHRHFIVQRRHHGHKHAGKKWRRTVWQNRRPQIVYVITQPAPAPVYVPVTAPVNVLNVEGNYCREFNSTAVIGGRKVPVYGTMCRQPDGSWTAAE